jgi:formamidopyrimidine-DNA glycosylase
VLDSDDYQQHRLIKNLGPEPLTDEFDGQWLKSKAKNKTQAVKNFIMDGKTLSVWAIFMPRNRYSVPAFIRPERPGAFQLSAWRV